MKRNREDEKIAALYQSAYESVCVSDEMKSDLRRLAMRNTKKKQFPVIKAVGAAAAAVCILFTGLVNGSAVFAASVENIPVIGKFAELVNFRSYTEETEDYAISVSIPAVKESGYEHADRSEAINDEIIRLCEQYADEAKERALEYREIFLETGGTEEEWKEHDITITVDYEIKSESENYLSFVVYGYESWISSEAVAYYYNLDVQTMEYVTLEKLLGADYMTLANEQITQQIRERQEAGDGVFFTQEEGGFETISEEQNFYVNAAGNVVIVFEKYTIAPGSMGTVEFEIVQTE